jgi:inner membrane transporter RhtA
MQAPGAQASPAPLVPGLAILAAMVSQYIGAAIAKHLFPLVGSEGVTALRVGLSALILVLAFRPWRTALTRRGALDIALYGFMLGCMNLLIYHAFSLIPIGIAVAIEVTGPLAVVVASSRRWRDLGWVACAALGLALLLPLRTGTGVLSPSLDPAGVAYALGAAFCWAMYIVFGKRASKLEGGQAVAWGMLAASLFTVPVGAAHAGAALLQPAVMLAGLAVALLSSALPYSLEIMALRRLPRHVFGILVSSAPAVGALAGFLVLGEQLTPVQWLAIVLVMAASAGSAATA